MTIIWLHSQSILVKYDGGTWVGRDLSQRDVMSPVRTEMYATFKSYYLNRWGDIPVVNALLFCMSKSRTVHSEELECWVNELHIIKYAEVYTI